MADQKLDRGSGSLKERSGPGREADRGGHPRAGAGGPPAGGLPTSGRGYGNTPAPPRGGEPIGKAERVLWSGVDTCYTSVYGDFVGDTKGILFKSVESACNESRSLRAPVERTLPFLGKARVKSGAKGLHNWPFHIDLESWGGLSLHLDWGQQADPRLARMYACFSAFALHNSGLDTCLWFLEDVCKAFDYQVSRISPSRVDYAFDVAMSVPPAYEELLHLCPSGPRETKPYLDGLHVETFYRGLASAPDSVKVYDKLRQLGDGAAWVWRDWGVENESDLPSFVYRTEVRLNRAYWHNRGVDSLEQMRKALIPEVRSLFAGRYFHGVDGVATSLWSCILDHLSNLPADGSSLSVVRSHHSKTPESTDKLLRYFARLLKRQSDYVGGCSAEQAVDTLWAALIADGSQLRRVGLSWGENEIAPF